MPSLGLRRSPRHRLLRALLLIVSFLLILDLLTLLKYYRLFSRSLVLNTVKHKDDLPNAARNQKIYICAQFWTNAAVINDHWGSALIELIQTLGPENVYVSIYESGSLDNTKEVLRYLDYELGNHNVQRTITLDPTTHEDEVKVGPVDEHGQEREGWIKTSTPGVEKELRRIPYLAKLRNLSLKPMLDLQNSGMTFDRVLFLNDVVFRPSDVLSLLATNDGSYAAACAFDFHLPPAYYDTFALRDSNGAGTVMSHFPYFRPSETLSAILRGEPARVQSCWNGMVAMEAAPFYPRQDTKALTFRGTPDSLAVKHLEGSECCLIHADLIIMGAASRGIYINPTVRVGYVGKAYDYTHRDEDQKFVSTSQYVAGVWANRIVRWVHPTDSWQSAVRKRVKAWQAEGNELGQKREELGEMCLIDETHILIWNGWKHV